MAPLPTPKTPSDIFLHDIAQSLRVLTDRDDDDQADGPVQLREPVQGVDATPTPVTSAGKAQAPADDTAPDGGDPNADPEAVPADGSFDPSDRTVDEVNTYLARDDVDEAERQRVLDAEKAGKDRKTVQAPAGDTEPDGE